MGRRCRPKLKQFGEASDFVRTALPEDNQVVRLGREPRKGVPCQFRNSFLERRLAAIKIRSHEGGTIIWESGRSSDFKKSLLSARPHRPVTCDDFHKDEKRML